MKSFQRRALGRSELQCRVTGGQPTQIFGYASVFNQVAYGEVIRPGAFTKTLAEQQDVKAYWNHDTSAILARTSNGTVALRQDNKGLYCEITPNPDTTWGRDALAACARGDVKGMSFGFRVIQSGRVEIDGENVEEIREVDLREVSPCADPWYDETEAQARNTVSGATIELCRSHLAILELATM
jgi:uncharacterized protein